MKIGNPAPKIPLIQYAEEAMSKHSNTFKRLAELEAREAANAVKESQPIIVETVVEKQDIHHTKIIHHTELISKPDHRARKYAKELNSRLNEKLDVAIEMIDDRLKHSAIRNSRTTEGLKLMSEANQICHQKMNELNRSIEELKARKPQEKQIVIEKPVTNKLVILGLCASLVLNVLILIIK